MLKRVPKAGDLVTTDDLEYILEAVHERQTNFPDEPAVVSIALVFMNIGSRFTPVECIEGEWSGYLMDVPKRPGEDPRCPNGHPVTKGKPLRIAWVDVPD